MFHTFTVTAAAGFAKTVLADTPEAAAKAVFPDYVDLLVDGSVEQGGWTVKYLASTGRKRLLAGMVRENTP